MPMGCMLLFSTFQYSYYMHMYYMYYIRARRLGMGAGCVLLTLPQTLLWRRSAACMTPEPSTG